MYYSVSVGLNHVRHQLRPSPLAMATVVFVLLAIAGSALAADCNGNGVTDRLDIISNPDLDCNDNGILDACEFSVSLPLGSLKALKPESNDQFAFDVALDGTIGVIGAQLKTTARATASGAAYVVQEIDGIWQHLAQLTASDAAPNDRFGYSVSISGSTIVVGAVRDDDNGIDSGAAYIFNSSGGEWAQVAKLKADDGVGDDFFGTSVAISGDTILIGAHGDDDDGSRSGSVYVFRKIGEMWQQVAKLTPDDAATYLLFGRNLALSGNTAVIGAYGGTKRGVKEGGTAYVFREIEGEWQQQAKLTASDNAPLDRFGFGVAIDGDTIVVGAHLDDAGAIDSGSAYIFREIAGVWQQIAKLKADDPSASAMFGVSVAIRNGTVVLGASGDSESSIEGGAVYISRELGGVWQRPIKVVSAESADHDRLGTSVTLNNHTMIIGAPCIRNNAAGNGSAFFFSLGIPDCTNNGVLDACDIASGIASDCNLNGVPDSCEPYGKNSQTCSHLDDTCVTGICNLATATCGTLPTNEGGCCDDHDACSPVDICVAGACVANRLNCGSNALPHECATKLYVDDSATNGLNDGSSWINAFVHLQDALDEAVPHCGITEIWVAAGTYRPDKGALHTPEDRTATFQLINGLSLYGGFAGSETTVDERNIESNRTILSGDLLGNDVWVRCTETSPDCDIVGGNCSLGRCNNDAFHKDNSLSVLTGSGTDSTAKVDGFVISNGSASGPEASNQGGGMTNIDASPVVSNCTFRNNTSDRNGGAILNDFANPTITGCKFYGNYADGYGGAIHNVNESSPFISNSVFSANSYVAVFNQSSSPSYTDCRFEGGSADNEAKIRNELSYVHIKGCVFENINGQLGAGIFNHDSVLIVDQCEFTANRAIRGGAIHIDGGEVSVTASTFKGNVAQISGGGIYIATGNCLIDGCEFFENVASLLDGGAVYRVSNLLHDELRIRNCTFTRNSAFEDGGAVGTNRRSIVSEPASNRKHTEEFGDGEIINCTMFANSAGHTGGALSGSYRLRNCIVWGNSPDQADFINPGFATNCLIQGGWSTSGGYCVFDARSLPNDPDGPGDIIGTIDDSR